MKLLITGGHHSSAMPVIERLRAEHPEIELVWVGHRYTLRDDTNDSLEYREITALNIPFYDVKAGKFYGIKNPIKWFKILLGFFRSFLLLIKLKPNGILSFGGYIAVPVVISGYLLGIPSITHEQTVVTGYANKVISFFAKKVLISWKESESYFPLKKVVFTGLPIRKAIFTKISDSFAVNGELPTIYITSGKSGSHKINLLVKESLSEILSLANVIHQAGDYSVTEDYEALKSLYESLGHLSKGKYFLRKFVLENEIGEVFQKSSLVVGRSGAHIVCELYALKKPCILIPISWVSHGEQQKNAEVLRARGLGKVLDEETLTPETLVKEIKDSLINIDSYKLKPEFENLTISQDADKLIVDEIIKNFSKG